MAFQEYVYQEYPKWVKGVRGGQVVDLIVQDASEEAQQKERVDVLAKAQEEASKAAAKANAAKAKATAKEAAKLAAEAAAEIGDEPEATQA